MESWEVIHKNKDAEKKTLREFIELYKNCPEVWKTTSENYKLITLKKRAYAKLLTKYKEIDKNATMDAMKSKINTLRTNYKRELNKVLKSENPEMGLGKIYVPTLWYFEDLNFLKDQRIPHQQRISVDLEQSLGMDQLQDNISQQSAKKQQSMEYCKNIPPKEEKTTQPHETNDEADIIARAWAVEYRKLCSNQQLIAKKKIDDILYYGRLGDLKHTTNSEV